MFPCPVPARRNNNKMRARELSVPRTLPVIYGFQWVAPSSARPESGKRVTSDFGCYRIPRNIGPRDKAGRNVLRGKKNKDGKETKINSPSANGYQNLENTDRARTAGPSCSNTRRKRPIRSRSAHNERVAEADIFFPPALNSGEIWGGEGRFE